MATAGIAALGTFAVHRPGLAVTLGSAFVALLLSALLWWVIGQAITLAHEGGHALVTVLFGGKVGGVWVRRDRTGLTLALGLGPVAAVFFTMAGYLGPSAFGVLAALLIVFGQFVAVLWISVVLLVMILLAARTWFTRFAIVTAGALFVLVLRTRSDGLLTWTACVWAWSLLIGGLVHVVRHNGKGMDHHALKKATWIPVWFWSLFFTVFALVALGYAFSWLTGLSSPPAGA